MLDGSTLLTTEGIPVGFATLTEYGIFSTEEDGDGLDWYGVNVAVNAEGQMIELRIAGLENARALMSAMQNVASIALYEL